MFSIPLFVSKMLANRERGYSNQYENVHSLIKRSRYKPLERFRDCIPFAKSILFHRMMLVYWINNIISINIMVSH